MSINTFSVWIHNAEWSLQDTHMAKRFNESSGWLHLSKY